MQTCTQRTASWRTPCPEFVHHNARPTGPLAGAPRAQNSYITTLGQRGPGIPPNHMGIKALLNSILRPQHAEAPHAKYTRRSSSNTSRALRGLETPWSAATACCNRLLQAPVASACCERLLHATLASACCTQLLKARNARLAASNCCKRLLQTPLQAPVATACYNAY